MKRSVLSASRFHLVEDMDGFSQPWSIDEGDFTSLAMFDLLCGGGASPQRDLKFNGFDDAFILEV